MGAIVAVVIIYCLIRYGTRVIGWAGRTLRGVRERSGTARTISLEGELTPESEPATFNVVALGTSGTGKTVLLSSIYHELRLARDARCYRIETDAAADLYLAGVHRQVADPDEQWPRGTQRPEGREFLFDFVVPNQNVNHDVMRIAYYDYAGELFEFAEEESSKSLRELHDRVTNAHALFALLDGKLLADYLRGAPEGLRYMGSTITSMISAMAKSQCPIHFIVTKWDLVRDVGERNEFDENERLGLVRSALHQHPELGCLLRDTGTGQRQVRLVPVSAVGNNFARVTKSGEVEKIEHATAEPINLHVPFSLVVPDFFDQLDTTLSSADRDKIEEKASQGPRVRIDILKGLTSSAQVAITVAMHFALQSPAAEPLVRFFFESIGPRDRDGSTDSGLEDDDLLSEDGLERAQRNARAALLDEFEKVTWILENQLPASRIRG